jgi:hypothetical protein
MSYQIAWPMTWARRSTKEAKGQNDAVREQVLETKCPVVVCGSVYQDEDVSEPTNRNTLPKCNIHMDGVKVSISGPIKRTTLFCIWYSGIWAKGSRKFTAINPFPISADQEKVFIITKLATAHSTMKFFCQPMHFCFQGISRIARVNRRKGSAQMVEKASHLVRSHSGEETRGQRSIILRWRFIRQRGLEGTRGRRR